MRHEDLHLAALRADEAAESARRADNRIEAAYFAGVAAALRACCPPTQSPSLETIASAESEFEADA